MESRRRPAQILRVVVPSGILLAALCVAAARAGGLSAAEGRTWIILGGLTATEAIPLLIVWAGLVPDWIGGLGLRRPRAAGSGAWTLGLAVAGAYLIATLWTNPVIAAHALDVHALQVLGLAAALVAGIVEEAVFRRLLMDGLARRGTGRANQVLASALSFGALHATWGAVAGSLEVALVAAGATTLLGAGLALTYLAGRRSLGPCIASHVLLDAVLEPWLIYAALGGS